MYFHSLHVEIILYKQIGMSLCFPEGSCDFEETVVGFLRSEIKVVFFQLCKNALSIMSFTSSILN